MFFNTLSTATVIFGCSLVQTTLAATPDEWRTRSIYQVVTDRFALDDGSTSTACNTTARQRCGGTWRGLQNKLDYISDLGFDAVWISPISQNIDGQTPYGEAYHGYWTQNLDVLNPYMGTVDDFNNLVTALHARDMYLMVDNVPNHFAHGQVSSTPSLTGSSPNIDLSQYSPFNTSADYHSFCWVDYSNDTSVTQCWMGDQNVPLMDLNTESAFVNASLLQFINNATAIYKVDGVRADAVKSIKKDFWRPWNDAAGVYALGEVYTGDPAVMCEYQHDALDALLNFPVWETIVGGFNSSTSSVAYVSSTAESVAKLCTDPTLLGSFIENQDLPRFKAYSTDDTLSHNAISYTMLADGIPVIYYGYEQGFSGYNDPTNREAMWLSGYSTNTTQYGWVKTLNHFRKSLIYSNGTYQPVQMTTLVNNAPTNVVSFLKGDSIVVTNNYGSKGGSKSVTVNTPWGGQSVYELWTNSTSTIPSDGTMKLTISNGSPMVFYPASLANCVAASSRDACLTSSTNKTAPIPSTTTAETSSASGSARSSSTGTSTGKSGSSSTASSTSTSAAKSAAVMQSTLNSGAILAGSFMFVVAFIA